MCRIPVERFREVVQPHVRKRDDDSDNPNMPGRVTLLAEVLDIPVDSLQRLLWGNRKSIEFDLAERILMELGLEHMWHIDEELNKIYMNAPLDTKLIYLTDLKLGTKCPSGHVRTEENTKVTGRGALTCTICLRERAPKKGWKAWKGVCPNGHERTPENTKIENGTPRCRACYLKRAAECRARKRAAKRAQSDPVIKALAA